MALLTDNEIKQALEKGDIEIEPFEERQLQSATYDMRLGKRAIISRTVTLEELEKQITREEAKETDIENEGSIRIPGGAFALVTTLERIKLEKNYVGHIGMSTYYVRKGLSLLSGLQIDPGWDGVLILGLVNVSPRSINIDYMDDICSIEIHRLNVEPNKVYSGSYKDYQREGKIPKQDKDYLRTIETMSVSELTGALVNMSRSVTQLSRDMRYFWIPVGLAFLAAAAAAITNFTTG
jgi:dCTP deaminase